MEYSDVEYLLTFTCALAAMGSLFAAAAFVASRLAGLGFRKSFAISGYPFATLVVFRALGYMMADIITKGGDLINYVASALGIHVYYPSALVSSAFLPVVPNTGYHFYGLLLTLPLALGLPVAWFLTYRTWRRLRGSPRRALLVSLPANAAMAILVAVYEWAYLAGYRVVQ